MNWDGINFGEPDNLTSGKTGYYKIFIFFCLY